MTREGRPRADVRHMSGNRFDFLELGEDDSAPKRPAGADADAQSLWSGATRLRSGGRRASRWRRSWTWTRAATGLIWSSRRRRPEAARNRLRLTPGTLRVVEVFGERGDGAGQFNFPDRPGRGPRGVLVRRRLLQPPRPAHHARRRRLAPRRAGQRAGAVPVAARRGDRRRECVLRRRAGQPPRPEVHARTACCNWSSAGPARGRANCAARRGSRSRPAPATSTSRTPATAASSASMRGALPGPDRGRATRRRRLQPAGPGDGCRRQSLRRRPVRAAVSCATTLWDGPPASSASFQQPRALACDNGSAVRRRRRRGVRPWTARRKAGSWPCRWRRAGCWRRWSGPGAAWAP